MSFDGKRPPSEGSTPPLHPAGRAALAFVFTTLLIDVLSFGIAIPVLPSLVKSFVHGSVAAAAPWYGWFQVAFMAMQFLFTPVQGALSDRYGRRPIILLSNLGSGLDFVFMALANSLPLLLVGRLICGITSASFSSANAYIADVTPPDRRAHAYGLIGVAFGTGLIIAPVVGGLLGAINLRLPFWVAAALCLVNFFYGVFVLPESLPAAMRSKTLSWVHANPLGSLMLLREFPRIIGLMAIIALDAAVHAIAPTTFALYANYRFGWGPPLIGATLALVGVLQLTVQGGLIRWIVDRLGEQRAVLFGLACGVIGLVGSGLAPNGFIFWLVMPIVALWGAAQPAIQSLMSRTVDPHHQGRLQGTVASVASLSGMLGSFAFPAILSMVTSAHMQGPAAGTTYFVAGSTLSAALVIAMRSFASRPKEMAADIASPH